MHNSNNNSNLLNGQKQNKCFRCGLEDHFIENVLKPDTSDKNVHWNTENPKTRVYISAKIDNTSEKIIDQS